MYLYKVVIITTRGPLSGQAAWPQHQRCPKKSWVESGAVPGPVLGLGGLSLRV